MPVTDGPPLTGPGVAAGVGRTALLVAAARAVETHRPDALARDPFAEHFVRAAPAAAGWPVHPDQVPDGDADPLWGHLGRYFGLRTRVLDDHLLRGTAAGLRQVVLLGAGLDTRAHRLDWPPGCTVHEIDTAEVLRFKQSVLDRTRATPKADRRPLAADLRGDWAEALCATATATGFDPAAPTAWLAEGLLLYLPAPAERALVAAVHRLSAPGSTLAYEIKYLTESHRTRAGPVYTEARRRLGIDLLALFDPDPRPDSAAELATLGWTVTEHTPYTFTDLHGRGPRPQPDDVLAANRWVFATKAGAPDVPAHQGG
ncbi:SAM-dependent methyltransferase [Streptomyces sp. NPDC048182]|uniref:SAM-dependent methyltransferase n=1 Tax=Streptomyces sp. NPDC048182 TaxID=3365507 RepID=UPI00371740A8